MSKRTVSTCEDCYFRREGLCALAGNTPCPTFRAATGRLEPPQQPQLLLRPSCRSSRGRRRSLTVSNIAA